MSIKGTLKRDLWTDPNYEVQQVACMELVFCGIDKALYGKLLEQGTTAGVKFNGTKATFKDCLFTWNYDEASGNLRVACKSRPFYLTCGEIEGELNKLINAAKESI